MSAVMSETKTRGYQLSDPKLKAVDAIAERWAELTRNGNPLASNILAKMVAQAEGAALPTGEQWIDDEVLAFDSVLAHAEARTKLFIDVWYCTHGTSDVKAVRLRISRTTLYEEWKQTLAYLAGAMKGLTVRTSGR